MPLSQHKTSKFHDPPNSLKIIKVGTEKKNGLVNACKDRKNYKSSRYFFPAFEPTSTFCNPVPQLKKKELP